MLTDRFDLVEDGRRIGPRRVFDRGTRMNIAEFKTELARLIEKGLAAGIARDDIANELNDVAENFTGGQNEPPDDQDPVGDLIASHRP
jgi:hypothetical protein